jgi:large subunit ribosomal protein L25
MTEILLEAEQRADTGKHAKYVRTRGLVPGVFYMRGEPNIVIQVPSVLLDKVVFTAETHIIDLRLKDGSSRKCVLRDVQFDPITDRPVHFDLQGLREHEKLTIDVPVVLVGGTAAGVREGGTLQHIVHRISLSCLPRDIPEKIEVNIAQLGINDFVHVKDLQIPNVTVLENAESSVVGVLPPTLVKEAPVEAVEAEAPAEPEVVGKGKKAGEEEGEVTEEKEKKKEKKEEKS